MEDFVAEITYLEYHQKQRCLNDNHVFLNKDLQEEKEIQLHSAHRRFSSENISRDTIFKPAREKLGQQHDRISLQVKCQYLEEKISYLKVGLQDMHKHCVKQKMITLFLVISCFDLNRNLFNGIDWCIISQ